MGLTEDECLIASRTTARISTSTRVLTSNRVTNTAGTRVTTASVPKWTGSGNLLNGYCATPEFTLINAVTATYWAPFIGCLGDKQDCCPFNAKTGGNGLATIFSTISPTAPTAVPIITSTVALNNYPTPYNAAEATLGQCPDDYVSIAGGCCPS